jgi:5-methylcytosine-specific restriction protein B
MAENVRNGLLVRTCLELLRDTDRPLPPAEAVAKVGERIGELTPYESGTIGSGRKVRWQNALGWHTGDMATVGWMSKTGGWHITDSGREALGRYAGADALLAALQR